MSRVINVEVTVKEGEPQERMIKRFFKNCKKANVVKEYLAKTSFFKPKRQKKKEKSENSTYLKNISKKKDRK